MSVPSLPLAQPIEWISVPGGKVTIKDPFHGYVDVRPPRTFDVSGFQISKYPISNAQFSQFIASGGYSKPVWWSLSGWLVKEAEGWQAPDGWETLSSSPLAPVIGVSWFEAEAFGLWLLAEARTLLMLPTEQQWQRAAEDSSSTSVADFNTNIEEWCTNQLKSGQPYLDLNSTVLYNQYHFDSDYPTHFVLRAGKNYVQGSRHLMLPESWFNGHSYLWYKDGRHWSEAYYRDGRRGFRVSYNSISRTTP